MKNVNSYKQWLLLALVAVATGSILPACRKNNVCGVPTITKVRNYAASPNDTATTAINQGQWVVLIGNNLSGVTQVTFGGIAASINSALFSDTSLVVQLPTIPFQTIAPDKLNKVTAYTACGSYTFDINVTGPPMIVRIRNGAEAPSDTVVSSIVPGQRINLIGYNFENASSINFQGVLANLGTLTLTDSSAFIQVPADLSGSVAALSNIITYTTPLGSGSYNIKIIGPPIISGVSLENPQTGDSVFLYGNNFINVQSVMFAGATVASFNVQANETKIGFRAPSLNQSGPVVVTAAGGIFTTAYNVNDIGTGALSNFEWGGKFEWEWWGGAELASGDPNSGWPAYNSNFPGNSSLYLNLKYTTLDPAAGADWSHAVRLPKLPWVPVANLTDAADRWALKFEYCVPANWLGGSMFIKSSNGDYVFRYEPWQTGPNSTAAFTTKGTPNKWETMVVPLSAFRKTDATLGIGRGTPAATVADIVKSDVAGSTELRLYMTNLQSVAVTNFNAAFDNFRVVKL